MEIPEWNNNVLAAERESRPLPGNSVLVQPAVHGPEWNNGISTDAEDPEALVNPLDLHHTTTEDESGPKKANLAYYRLKFDDCNHDVKTLEIIIGRDLKVEQMLDLDQPVRPRYESPDQDFQDDEVDKREDMEHVSRRQRRRTALAGGSFSRHGGALSSYSGGLEDPDDEPFIGIHPAQNADGTVPSMKPISRRHMRIYHDSDEGWMMEVLGRNGAFRNGTYYAKGSTTHLEHMDVLAIHGLEFEFLLGVTYEDDDFEEDDNVSNDSEMEVHRDGLLDSSEDELPMRRKTKKSARKAIYNDSGITEHENYEGDSDEEREEGDEEDDEDGDENEAKAPAIKRQKQPQVAQKKQKEPTTKRKRPQDEPPETNGEAAGPSTKKRGPGRPPKNGFMSQREMREQRKAQKAAGIVAPDLLNGGALVPGSKDGNDGGLDADGQPKKRKYTKRNSTKFESSDLAGVNGGPSAASAEYRSAVAASRDSPEPKKEDFTEEELRKPNDTYVQLLFKVLSDADGPMTLQTIYKAIKKRWPYYIFCETDGWQSSVRHNLIQTDIFRKANKVRKGHDWELVPGSQLEPKKQRRTTPPPPPRRTTGFMHGPTHSLPPNPHFQPYGLSHSANAARYSQTPLSSFGSVPNGNLSGSQSQNQYASPYRNGGPARPPYSQNSAGTAAQDLNQRQPNANRPQQMPGATFIRPPTQPSSSLPMRAPTESNTRQAQTSTNSQLTNSQQPPSQPLTASSSSPLSHLPPPRPGIPPIFAQFRQSFISQRGVSASDCAQVDDAIDRVMNPNDARGPPSSRTREVMGILGGLYNQVSRMPPRSGLGAQTPGNRASPATNTPAASGTPPAGGPSPVTPAPPTPQAAAAAPAVPAVPAASRNS